MVNFKKKNRGKIGERIAADYLVHEEYEIIDRNWRIKEGEIDIVARVGNTIVFVEVKTAFSDKFGDPEEWVNTAKRRQIGKIAGAWIDKHNPDDCVYRFDVVALHKVPGGFDIRHIENAFSL